MPSETELSEKNDEDETFNFEINVDDGEAVFLDVTRSLNTHKNVSYFIEYLIVERNSNESVVKR